MCKIDPEHTEHCALCGSSFAPEFGCVCALFPPPNGEAEHSESSETHDSEMNTIWCTRCAERGRLECDISSTSQCTRCVEDPINLWRPGSGYNPGPCRPAERSYWPSDPKIQQKLEKILDQHGSIARAKAAVTPLRPPMKIEDRPIFDWCHHCAKEGKMDCNFATRRICDECIRLGVRGCRSGKGIWPETHQIWAKARLENRIVEERRKGKFPAAPAAGSAKGMIARHVYGEAIERGQRVQEHARGNSGKPQGHAAKSHRPALQHQQAPKHASFQAERSVLHDVRHQNKLAKDHGFARTDTAPEQRTENAVLRQLLDEAEDEAGRLRLQIRDTKRPPQAYATETRGEDSHNLKRRRDLTPVDTKQEHRGLERYRDYSRYHREQEERHSYQQTSQRHVKAPSGGGSPGRLAEVSRNDAGHQGRHRASVRRTGGYEDVVCGERGREHRG